MSSAAVFDAIVVGTGQAGPSLAARLSAAGWSVAVVEENRFGGTCVNNGCTPTKAMIASAYAARTAARAVDYGVVLDTGPRVDMKRVKARKDEIVGNSSRSIEQWMAGLKGVTVYPGHARFVGRTELAVGLQRLQADSIFLNVGGRPSEPAIPGVDEVSYLTNVTMMDLDIVPPHLVVVGGSYVGLEFAQMFRRFGSRVTVVETGPLGAECISVRKEADGVSVGVSCKAGSPRERGTHLLLAVGRVPNTDDLALDAAGVAVDKRGYIEVDEGLRTTNPRVWALGDCNGKGAFTHTAYNDYEIVADNLLANAGRKYTDRVPVYALYTDPPLGRVGMSEAEIRKSGLKALVGKRPMSRVARAIEKGETNGFLKIHVEQGSKRILGAALLGSGADESVHSMLDAVYSKLPYPEFQRRVRIHPTVSELLPTVLESLSPL